MEAMYEIYNIKEIPDRTFPLQFNIIGCYQREDPILMETLNCADYQTGYFFGDQNNTKIVTCEDKIVITQQLQNI